MTHSKEGLLNLKREFLNEEIKGAEKCVKKCTPSFTIRECKLKGFCDFILTSVRMATIKRAMDSKSW